MPEISAQKLQEENALLRQEVEFLRRKLQVVLKKLFGGGQGERVDPRQLELLLGEVIRRVQEEVAAVPVEKIQGKIVRRSRGRKRLPDLETEEVTLEPLEVTASPGLWVKIGEERTEELDMKPAQFIKRVYLRPRYVNRAEGKVVIARLPNRLIEKGLPGPGLLAQIVVGKYEDHLPLYRQAKIFTERYGVEIARQRMSDWMERVAWELLPIYQAMERNLFSGDYVQADETPIRYLDPDLPGKSQQGYLWVYGRPGGDVIFDWQTSRGTEAAQIKLKDFKGWLQSDGYAVYERVAREQEGIRRMGCWAHARRKFHTALEESPKKAAWFLKEIGLLYHVESQLREARAGPEQRLAERKQKCPRILKRIHRAARWFVRKTLPQSQLGKALGYTLAEWEQLIRYVEDGCLEIDNNLIENAIRPTAVGKKNWLFIGHPDAGQKSAVIYSILGSCRRAGVNPFEYLVDVFKRLPDMKMNQLDQLLPSRWAELQNAQSQSIAA
jgi:transposase